LFTEKHLLTISV